MGGISDAAIRERAYQIWEREGRPHGRDFEHWVRAQVELTVEASGNNNSRKKSAAPAPAPARARPATAKSAPVKPGKPGAGRKGRSR